MFLVRIILVCCVYFTAATVDLITTLQKKAIFKRLWLKLSGDEVGHVSEIEPTLHSVNKHLPRDGSCSYTFSHLSKRTTIHFTRGTNSCLIFHWLLVIHSTRYSEHLHYTSSSLWGRQSTGHVLATPSSSFINIRYISQIRSWRLEQCNYDYPVRTPMSWHYYNNATWWLMFVPQLIKFPVDTFKPRLSKLLLLRLSDVFKNPCGRNEQISYSLSRKPWMINPLRTGVFLSLKKYILIHSYLVLSANKCDGNLCPACLQAIKMAVKQATVLYAWVKWKVIRKASSYRHTPGTEYQNLPYLSSLPVDGIRSFAFGVTTK